MLATPRVLFKVAEALVLVVFMVTTMTRSVASNLIIDPPGPVAVFDLSISSLHSKQIAITCTSTGNLNITWGIPTFNFAELNKRSDFDSLLSEGKTENDLFRRVEISTRLNGNKDGFTSILTIRNPTTWDEGYYTCQTTNTNKRISSRIYIFLPGQRRSTNFDSNLTNPVEAFAIESIQGPGYEDVDPLRSFYVVPDPSSSPTKKSSITIPCLIRGLTGSNNDRYQISGTKIGSSLGSSASSAILSDTVLQRKADAVDGGKWEQVVNNRDQLRKWTYNETFQGFELYFSEEDAGTLGAYRCVIVENLSTFGSTRFISEPFTVFVEGRINRTEDLQPIIRPSVKYLVFQTGSTFNLTCEVKKSRGNITWESPDSRIPPAVKRSKTTTAWSQSDNGITVATLTVSKATYADSGYYICRSVENDKLFSEQFIFVQDWNTLMTFTFRPYRMQSFFGSSLPSFHISETRNTVIVAAPFSFPVVVRIIPTSPPLFLIDIKLFRLVRGQRRAQVYPPTRLDDEGSWSYDMFDGFKMKNSSWDIAGDYEVEGIYVREYEVFEFNSPRTIDQRHFALQFSIYVEGMEMTSSEPQAIVGREFSLKCQWRFPYAVLQNVKHRGENKFDWLWTPSHQNQQRNSTRNRDFHQQLGTERDWGAGELWPASRNDPERIYNSILAFKNLTLEANGTFECFLNYTYRDHPNDIGVEGNFTRIYRMNVLVRKAPIIAESNPASGIKDVAIGDENVTLSCQVDAVPTADIRWTNGQGLPIIEGISIHSDGSKTSLTYRVITSNFSTSGEEFTCHFKNTEGTTSKTFRIRLKSDELHPGIIFGIIAVIALFVLLLGLLSRSIYLTRKRDKLIRLTRERLLNGDPGRFDPEIPLDEQVNLLPYDSQWEFPRNNIIFGKQLGAGQFGVVVQAKQIGTVHDPKDNKVRTVAVKMVKSSLNTTSLESLASELKIMIHLGPHLNVVNVLGACTKEIVNGELLVIEEFCRFGNIHDYLIANRGSFINELVETISEPQSSGIGIVQSHQDNHDQQQSTSSARYIAMTQSDQQRDSILGPSIQNAPRDSILFSMLNQEDDNQYVLSHNNGYMMPNTGSLEREEMISSRNPISTQDLISWSFQIANGMNHLANKKVIHGDLAARNVLLADGNIVKIADFGLSRQIKYNDGTYLKKGEEALPVKWMAIESLTDRIFTTQSDVWSYGVVLWELFSLGQMPYAEVTILKDLIRLLRSGERLEKPSFMPDPVSQIMVKCWENDPKKRPSFSQLGREVGSMLANDIQNQYLLK